MVIFLNFLLTLILVLTILFYLISRKYKKVIIFLTKQVASGGDDFLEKLSLYGNKKTNLTLEKAKIKHKVYFWLFICFLMTMLAILIAVTLISNYGS